MATQDIMAPPVGQPFDFDREAALAFVPTHDADTGRELTGDERNIAADRIVESARANVAWRRGLTVPEQLAVADSPVVSAANEADADSADDGGGGTKPPRSSGRGK